MSWVATSGYAPGLLKKPGSASSIIGANSNNSTSAGSAAHQSFSAAFSVSESSSSSNSGGDAFSSTTDRDVVVPLVLWGEAPRIDVSCLHVLYLPLSQPSQNSNTATHMRRRASGSDTSSAVSNRSAADRARIAGLQIQIVDDDDDDSDAFLYQTCVFAGTIDGAVIYWLMERDVVVQVSLLVFARDANNNDEDDYANSNNAADDDDDPRVQGLVSGIDEWGQSILVSITRSGRVARWQLPNGVCSGANAALASQLAPVEGAAMFCNARYAVVYSAATRMMVLDTWTLALLFCVDTAQEQIRRSIAVGELKRVVLPPTARGKAPVRAWPQSATAPGTSSNVAAVASTGATATTTGGISSSYAAAPTWDSLVVSLGAEGLVKCFLWSKPRGTSSNTTNSNTAGAFQWRQESCWVLSWADDADDLTCSQSTSLKDGDHMNPQTALMRSIKSSYFPLAVRVSPDASLLLFVWPTKWAVLKRKWLCGFDAPVATTNDISSSSRSNVATTTTFVGSCNIAPAAFVLKQTSSSGNNSNNSASTAAAIGWTSGEFIGDTHVVLYATTGHVFRFAVGGNNTTTAPSTATAAANGKLFLFTKDQDQFVPRSNFKTLPAIEQSECIASMHQCTCCSHPSSAGGGARTATQRDRPARIRRCSDNDDDDANANATGFTACVQSIGTFINASSPLALARSQTTLVHMCRRGSVGFWDIPLTRPRMSSPSSRMTATSAQLPTVQLADRMHLYSFTDGIRTALLASSNNTAGNDDDASESSGRDRRRVSVSHLLLGRDESGASCSVAELRRVGRRRNQHQRSPRAHVNTRDALERTTARASPVPADGRRATATAASMATIDVSAQQYLLDVPVTVHGFSDGSVEIALLGRARNSTHISQAANRVDDVIDANDDSNDAIVRLACHRGSVTAIAHCYWPAVSSGSAIEAATASGSAPIRLSATPGTAPSTPTGSNSSSTAGIYMTAKKVKTYKRGVPIEESIFASDKNPFYRSRVAASTTSRRSWSSRNLNVNANSAAATAAGSASAPCSPIIGGSRARAVATAAPLASPSTPTIYFIVFTGGADGTMRVLELALRPVASTFTCNATMLQHFRKHRGAIQEVAISPMRDADAHAASPDRLVATVGVDRKVVVYAPVYSTIGSSNSNHPNANAPSKSRCGVEWECILELSEHSDTVCRLEWHLERSLLFVECDDRMVSVWNVDTGVLERSVPVALLYAGGNAAIDASVSSSRSHSNSSSSSATRSVTSSMLTIGDASARLLAFRVIHSAEQIKRSWRTYFYSLHATGSSTDATVSPYAIGSIEMLLLSFLLSWGATPEIDRACRELLGLDAPELLFSCALRDGASGALTIPVPWRASTTASTSPRALVSHTEVQTSQQPATIRENAFIRNWQHSAALSANLALGIVALCMNLMEHKYSRPAADMTSSSASLNTVTMLPSSPTNKESFHVLWSQLITQHSVVLPDYVPHFREPALVDLARFGFHACDYTQLAARALLISVIERLPAAARSALTAEYSLKLHCELVRLETATGAKLSYYTTHSSNAPSTSNSNAQGTSALPLMLDTSVVIARVGALVVLLSLIGTLFPGEIPPPSAREVADVLVVLLHAPAPSHVHAVAAELLTKGLMLFRPHLVDLSSLITQLLVLDVRAKQQRSASLNSNTSAYDLPLVGSLESALDDSSRIDRYDPMADDSLSDMTARARVSSVAASNSHSHSKNNASLQLLLELGASETAFVLALLQQEMHNTDRSHAFRESALLFLIELLSTHYLLLYRHLPAVVDIIMCCLDPTKLERRKRCLLLSTRCLHRLVQRFPMVDFHKQTQRLAIGTLEAVILIYDLRTATKWRVLDGHTSAVSALAMRSDGQLLVSYAARERSVRWWNSGNAGLFGGMLKMQQTCLKEHKLDSVVKTTAAVSTSASDLKHVLQTCRLQFLTLHEPSIVVPTAHSSSNSNSNNNAVLREKSILRLTREDASQVQFLL